MAAIRLLLLTGCRKSEILTLRWSKGSNPITRQRPRVAAHGMIVAGFRHLASRTGDPQLHTHCVLANMTRYASGGMRSVEPTAIHEAV